MEPITQRIIALLPEYNTRKIRAVLQSLAAGIPIEQIRIERELVHAVLEIGRFLAVHQFAAASHSDRRGTRITIEGSSEELLRLLRQLLEQKQQADA